MRHMVRIGCALIATVLVCGAFTQPQETDVILRAMQDEIERVAALKILGLDAPYFVKYRIEDADTISIGASLGGLLASSRTSVRVPLVQVRVGDYNFDNSNYIYSDYYSGARFDPERLPLDNDYTGIRRVLWLATDRSFKTAEEAIARKRSALKNINLPDRLPDYSKALSTRAVLPIRKAPVDEETWKARVVRLSGVFSDFPDVLASGVEFESIQSTDYIVTNEGLSIRAPENIAYLRVRAAGQAPDGMTLRDTEVFQSDLASALPPESEVKRGIAQVGEDIRALAKAPVGETYDGPVLFEARAAAQLFGQLLGDNLKVVRKPIGEPGHPVPHLPSELESRVGSRILPEWMDVVDDPTQSEWRGKALLGHYEYDMEGQGPKALPLIEHGVLKSFLLTRTPVLKPSETTNARARMTGNYGAEAPGFGNMFVRASKTVSAQNLKKQLIDLCKERNKEYGILVRKLDYPSSASVDEFRRMSAAMVQSGGGTRPVVPPLLVYRVYPDGREELIRGVRFRGVSTRSFKDIIAASDEGYVFNFIDDTAPFAMMGAGSFITAATVVSPSILFDELELEPEQEELPKPPIVPPPPLS